MSIDERSLQFIRNDDLVISRDGTAAVDAHGRAGSEISVSEPLTNPGEIW